MKKVIVGILIGIVVVIGGCAAMFTAGVSSVDKAVNQVKEDTVKNDSKVQDLAKDMSWEVEKDQFTTKIVGTFENKSNEKIGYLQFDYKLIDKEGIVIESSFTNETDIMPKEKRKVEILCSKNNFDKYEITAKSSAF
ncbi:FxLYD domain-containing protein [Paraclostridium bifermentans]|uniref:FxLYD domain-containing protein n=1 Tax=Paraclostridium bifermentans TaxID=1490 RepID=UPI00189AE927|nr:FxLYD domain-containing protein [Paraclostridium bifermentans]